LIADHTQTHVGQLIQGQFQGFVDDNTTECFDDAPIETGNKAKQPPAETDNGAEQEPVETCGGAEHAPTEPCHNAKKH